MKKRTIKAADLFCGAGGTSTGLQLACSELGIDLDLVAVNHWNIAIETHSKNHPDAAHFCTNLDNVDPLTLVPGGELDLLVASPECTHHSVARGGKPINDQSRASAWRVLEWASKLRVRTILIENVKEFRTWGGLAANGRPLKRRKGETYFAFLQALRSLGYTVEDRVLNAADFDNPTSRERLFIIATLTRKPIRWPEPTHGPAPKAESKNRTLFDLSTKRQPHRPARDIIDWSIESESIYTRKRPLRPNTMARIFAGLRKFCGLPFIVPNFGEREGQEPRTHSLDRPLPAVTSHGAGALVQPFLVKYYGGHDAESLDKPLPTVTANYEHYGLCQPFIVVLRNHDQPRSIDEPLATICAGGTHQALCQPFLIGMRNPCGPGKSQSVDEPLDTLFDDKALVQPFLIRYNGNHKGRTDGDQRSHGIDDPIPAIDTSNRFGLVQPFLIGAGGPRGAGNPQSVDAPLGTVLTDDHRALVQPFIIALNHGHQTHRSHDINKPFPTITTLDAWGIVEPFLTKYNGTGGAQPVDEPLDTVTSKDRFGLVEPKLEEGEGLAILDIRFRMLQPHELAAAMSFPKSYHFVGNREKVVKQIGNAVPVNLAKALCKSILAA